MSPLPGGCGYCFLSPPCGGACQPVSMWRNVLGVIVGLAFDWLASLALGLTLALCLVLFLALNGVPVHAWPEHLVASTKKPFFILAESGLGAFGGLIGGFVTGWIARSHRLVCGGIMGVLVNVSTLPFWSTEPFWANLLDLVLAIVMATSGAWLAEAVFGVRRPALPQ